MFIILRFPSPPPASQPYTRQDPGRIAFPGEAAETDGPPERMAWSAAGLRGIFATVFPSGPGPYVATRLTRNGAFRVGGTGMGTTVSVL